MKKEKIIDSSMLDEAIIFATKAHEKTVRKGTKLPYIVHPIEAVAIVATMTDDQELLAAAALHDVIEDTHYTYEDIKVKFGERVANFVSQESDEVYPDLPKEESWKIRKTHALARLKSSSKETKIIALGDKLSNMRAIYRDHKAEGESFWNRFNVKDPLEQEWYYRGLKDSLSELNGTEAYKEFVELLEKVFNK